MKDFGLLAALVSGICAVVYGLWLAWPPLAPIVSGAALVTFVVGAVRQSKEKADADAGK
jgi:hypothetical protein